MTGDGNWTWYLPGRVPTLVDAGTGDDRHVTAVAAALSGARLAQVLVTHGHTDHASGAPALAARFPGARFRKMPWAERDARYAIAWEPLADDVTIEAGDGVLRVLHTPGHAPDHLCFFDAGAGVVFCGDLVVKGTTVWIPGNEHGDVGAYLESLRRILALDPVRLLPAHGEVIDAPASLLRTYISHRHDREVQIAETLRGGAATAEAITARIYRGLKPSLLPIATESVTAHLRKLERDGRARRDGDAWSIIEP